MSVASDVESKLKKAFGEQILEVRIPRERRIFARIPLPKIKEVINYLKQSFGMMHITAITAIDVGDDIEVLYHFFCQGVTISLSTLVPKANPVLDTITPIMPGAILYEREIQDLLGLKVKDHPDPRRLILPDDWEEGVYPLRKDYKVEVKEG